MTLFGGSVSDSYMGNTSLPDLAFTHTDLDGKVVSNMQYITNKHFAVHDSYPDNTWQNFPLYCQSTINWLPYLMTNVVISNFPKFSKNMADTQIGLDSSSEYKM